MMHFLENGIIPASTKVHSEKVVHTIQRTLLIEKKGK